MLGIGRHTDYASRVILHLAAAEPGAKVTTGEIAAMRIIPPAFIRRIVSRLSAAGLVRTSRGVGGGISLAVPASQINLKDVVEAMEGPVALNVCVEDRRGCPLSADCPVSGAWAAITADLLDMLEAVRFDALARGLKAGGRPDAEKTGPAKRGTDLKAR
jgi:Rrf2 family protein